MKLLPILLLAPTIAFAQVFSSPNQDGGEIVLTARDCVYNGKKYENLREAYSWSPRGRTLQACWTIKDGNVGMVYLDDGEERMYPLNMFKEKK
jgi:hypothetical protein